MTQLVVAGGAGARAAGDARAARRHVRACRRAAGRRAARAGVEARRHQRRGAAQAQRRAAGMRRYFETYPYICLEQKTSQVGRAEGRQALGGSRERAADLPRQRRPRELFPAARRRCAARQRSADRLRARGDARGRLRAAAARRATRCSAGLRHSSKAASSASSGRRASDLDVRKLAAIEALSRYGRAQPKMLGSVNIAPNLWPTAALIDWLNVLRRVDGIADRAAAARRGAADPARRA